MTRIPQEPPKINALPEGVTRPLWSVMIPVFNCAGYLRETIESVLRQDLGEQEMQIEVVDDASTDADVQKLVEEVGKGRVSYFRQPVNVGSLRNFETCINRSVGRLVHLLHGDDTVNIGYYQKITQIFEKFPEAGAAFCKNSYMDDLGYIGAEEENLLDSDGLIPGWLYKIAQFQRLQYVAMTVKREVYEALGSFYGMTFGEDWEMWVRIAKSYPTAYTPELLANYRLHFSSISGGAYRNGKNIKDLSKAIGLINKHITERDKKKMLRISRKAVSHNALNFTSYIWSKTRNQEIVFWQVVEALRLHRDTYTIKKGFRLLYQSLRNRSLIG